MPMITASPMSSAPRAAENATLRPKPTPFPVRVRSTRGPPGRMVESLMVGRLRWEVDPYPSTLSARAIGAGGTRRDEIEPEIGIEPMTCGLQNRCSAD